MDWTSNEMIALYIAIAIAAGAAIACFVLRNTVRTRLRTEKQIREDPDVHEWLVVFDWTPKILYVPTIAASVVAAGAMYILKSVDPGLIGGVWLAVFFLNYLVEEYEMSIKVLLIGLLCLGLLFLWLHLLGWVVPFLKLFKHLAISVSAAGFLLLAIIGMLTVFISWLKGLFFYVALTPNYMNIQEGPTETGEQISREDYNTRVDTGDFLERLFGFGRIVITFKDQKRIPLVLLVWNIKQKAQDLEALRASISIDTHNG